MNRRPIPADLAGPISATGVYREESAMSSGWSEARGSIIVRVARHSYEGMKGGQIGTRKSARLRYSTRRQVHA